MTYSRPRYIVDSIAFSERTNNFFVAFRRTTNDGCTTSITRRHIGLVSVLFFELMHGSDGRDVIGRRSLLCHDIKVSRSNYILV